VIEPILGAGPGYATVVTFHPHPQEFFSKQRRSLLTPIAEKAQVLAHLGVEQLVQLPFTADLAVMSPEAFVKQILVNGLRASRVSVGQDFCFGYRRSGTAVDLVQLAATFGIAVDCVPLHTQGSDRISSSQIRHALQHGQVSLANQLLGRAYTLCGTVMPGQQLGRTLGFPTANLQLPPEKFLPKDGVYAVWVTGKDGEPLESGISSLDLNKNRPLPGVMNIGMRPTVNGTQRTVEVHLLDWSGDLYHQPLTASLVAYLRGEQAFESLEALKAQIQQDCDQARSLFSTSSTPLPLGE
jgi:riboflavin kinase/FMN adenylyltransferase